MAIVAASRNLPRTRTALHRTVAPTLSSLYCLQQSRGLHFGHWCDHLKANYHHDCRRHRASRYRCMDTISRKLSWDNGSRSHHARLAMKRAMAHIMSDKRTPESPYVNPDKVQSWSDDISGLRPGRNIEDAERDAIDHLFRSRRNGSYEHDLWMSPLRHIQNYLASHHAPKDISPEDVITATTDRHDIGGSASQNQPSSSVRQGSTGRQHPRKHAHLMPAGISEAISVAPSSSVPKSENVATNTGASGTSSDAEGYGPALWNEPDGLPPKTAEERSKAYSDLHKYKPVSWNEPEGLQPKSAEELSKGYEDLSEYAAVKWNEPDGLPKPTPEELSKNYSDVDEYTPVHWNEPDGLPDPTPEELSKRYDDLNKYKPVEWNEPQGLPEPSPEEQSKNYDDLDTYSGPFTAPDKAIEAHAASQLDTTVKAQALPEKVEIASPPPAYEDLDKYGPVHWNEPDGLQKPTSEEASKEYDDLHLYGAVQWNEPDGLPQPTLEEQSKKYEDLAAYKPESRPGPEVVLSRIHPEEASKAYDDLDLYAVQTLDSVDKPYPMHPEEATKVYQDLEAYQPVYHTEASGAANASSSLRDDALRDFDKNHRDAAGYTSHLSSHSRHYLDQEQNDVEALTAQQIRARMSRNHAEQDRPRDLDEEMTKYESAWNSASLEAQQSLKRSKSISPSAMTGNYVRDFPEDFSGSWVAKADSASLLPQDMQEKDMGAASIAENGSRDDFELSSMDESFPLMESRVQSRIEPALDRVTSTSRPLGGSPVCEVADNFSNIPQGLEASFQVESEGRTTTPTMTTHYHAMNAGSKISSLENESHKERAVGDGTYKVLAYDNTTQSVSVAEMTSSVLDQQPPSSPSEVMLKLTNPARFLPHFGLLHSQGYEVVSGSGDVLIFRRVRPATQDTPAENLGQGPINPIDLMGKPVVGNFASPTGFVNYETLANAEVLKPEPPFRSNVDVHKEQPALGGSGTEQEHNRPRKKSIGRRLAVGGAWTIGIAYAVGVLAEYFSTGGLDGLGPRGL
ncbi:hypothetical protein NLU13_5863 [Sarocladium strictum]|uniref:Uncharacterized protein n=1 Tax=Sarocladium strictum TaxID=5046 RepID=A0AA39L682_SARSR|nr:hypothetical protein NLU13_5863 [Sarocladium strictum]